MFPATNNFTHHHQPMSSNITSTSSGVDDDCGGGHYIEHQVSQFDTLAGVAIKYGVEVADIKRMNGLATDLQMYALKSLQIPSLRRHPPAPSLSNGSPSPGESSRRTPHRRRHSYAFESLMKSPQHKVSPAMSTLQNYYGLKSPNPKGLAEGTELAVYSTGNSDHSDEGLRHKVPPISDSLFNRLHKSRILANDSLLENGALFKDVPITDVKDGEGERSNEKSVRRRQKADVDSGGGTPEMLLKEENGGSSSSSFPALTGKGLSLRPKSSSRLAADESGWLSSTISALRDPLMTDGLGGVHKSLSTSSLQDQDNNSTSVWLTSKWGLKPDLQARSAASIARPIFDGLPKPITGRKNKAALD